MNPIREHLPLLARHEGLWEGEYTHLGPDRGVQDQHLFRILVEIPDAGPAHYRQSSHYWWPDGRSQQLVYEGCCRDSRVHIDDGRIRGACWAIDDETLYITFGFHADPAGHVCEMIQLSPDGAHRARTWHWFRDHVLWRVTLVREHRLPGAAERFQALAALPPTLPWRE